MPKLTISRGNAKIGKIYNVSLPPIKSCPTGVPCSSKCYALKSYRMYPSVRAAWDGNWDLWRSSPADYFGQLADFIAKKKPAFFRYHVAGDIPSEKYFDYMVYTARKFSSTRFLAYTKTGFYKLAMPSNIVVLHSVWLDDQPIAGAKNFTVYYSDKQRKDAGAVPCAGSCDACKLCDNAAKPINIGVVLH